MSEPAPSSPFATTALILVMLCVAALLYLDWRRQGEIELLHERIDSLPQAAPRTLRPSTPREDAAPSPAAVHVPAPASAPPAPPAPAPERAATEGDVIRDPLPGREGGSNGMPEKSDVHPLLRSVMEAHGDA
jgi:hypothetical protein